MVRLHDSQEGLIFSWSSSIVSMLTAIHNAAGSRSLETNHASQGQPGGPSGHQFQPQFQRDDGAYC